MMYTLTQQESHSLQDLDVIVHFECVVELKYVFGSMDSKFINNFGAEEVLLTKHTCRW